MSAWDALVTMYLGGILFPFIHMSLTSLMRIRRGFEEKTEQHAAWCDGLEAGAGLDERDRREALRRRLKLE
jgi:hypothetical protein